MLQKLKRLTMRTKLLMLGYLLACTFPSFVKGQIVKPQNIYRVTVVSEYEIEEGKYTSKSTPIFQLISDSLGRLHTEIDYTLETRYPDNYRWHYFEGLTKKKTDFFLKEKLVRIEEYEHTISGMLSEVRFFKVNINDTMLVVRETYIYDINGKLTQSTGFDNRNKRGYRVMYKYDDKGTMIERQTKGKRLSPPDSILFLKRAPQYDSLGRISYETLEVEKVGKPRSVRIVEYKYDSKNNLTEKTIKDKDGKQIKRKEFVYRHDDRLQRRSIYDEADNLIEFRAWRYEIYKTSDRRNRVLE